MITLAGVRIIAAFFLAYLLPAFLRHRRRPDLRAGWLRLVHGFALTAACFEGVSLVLALGGRGFHYVEAMVAVWLALIGYALFGGGSGSLFRQVVIKVLRMIEAGRSQLGVRSIWQLVSPAILIGG